MTKLSKIVTSIQEAGQKTYDALTAAREALDEAKHAFTQSIIKDPNAHVNDGQYQSLKDLATLEQSLARIELELQGVYAFAGEATGVTIKRAAPIAIAGPERAKLLVAKEDGSILENKPTSLTPSSTAVWKFFQSALGTTSVTVIKNAEVAEKSGIPLGSVGAAIARLSSLGYIRGSAKDGYIRLID